MAIEGKAQRECSGYDPDRNGYGPERNSPLVLQCLPLDVPQSSSNFALAARGPTSRRR